MEQRQRNTLATRTVGYLLCALAFAWVALDNLQLRQSLRTSLSEVSALLSEDEVNGQPGKALNSYYESVYAHLPDPLAPALLLIGGAAILLGSSRREYFSSKPVDATQLLRQGPGEPSVTGDDMSSPKWIDGREALALIEKWRGAKAEVWGYSVSHGQLLIRVYWEREPSDLSLYLYFKGCKRVAFDTSWKNLNLETKSVAGEYGPETEVTDSSRFFVRSLGGPFAHETFDFLRLEGLGA